MVMTVLTDTKFNWRGGFWILRLIKLKHCRATVLKSLGTLHGVFLHEIWCLLQNQQIFKSWDFFVVTEGIKVSVKMPVKRVQMCSCVWHLDTSNNHNPGYMCCRDVQCIIQGQLSEARSSDPPISKSRWLKVKGLWVLHINTLQVFLHSPALLLEVDRWLWRSQSSYMELLIATGLKTSVRNDAG